MKRALWLFGLNLVLVQAMAQEHEQQGRFSFGLMASLDYNYRILAIQDKENATKNLKEARNDREQGILSWTAGVKVRYHLKPGFNAQFGMTYAIHGYQTEWIDVFPSPMNPYPLSDTERLKIKYNYHYLSIPIELQRQLGGGTGPWFVSFGLINHFFLKEKVKTFYDVGDETEKEVADSHEDNRSYVVSASIGAGYSKRIGDRMTLEIGPKFRFNLTNIIDAPLTAHFWNVGIQSTMWF